jgi:hypothetical protein
MQAPIFVLDSREAWRPVAVEESLKLHGYEWLDGEWRKAGAATKRIDLPPGIKSPQLPLVGYYRTVDGGGLVWHQFWTWWLYNPKVYAGRGDHEGDWEMVQLGCVDGRPILMTCSQHSGGEKREFWRVKLQDDGPVVYVARDSHANYFAPERDVTDIADGTGEVLDEVEWRPFGAWAKWDGKWGNSQNSPGALFSRRAWTAPHAWHGQARG